MYTVSFKNKLSHSILCALTILTSCSPEQKGNHYQIGSKQWYIEFPKNYVSYANIPDTVERSIICGQELKAKIIKLVYLQKDDTLWVNPMPNSVSVFLIPQLSMKKKQKECIQQMIETYSMFIELGSGREYRHKEKEVKIDGFEFMELENSIYDTTGVFSHGDIQLIGKVAENWMQVQVSFNDTSERDKLRTLILSSKFE